MIRKTLVLIHILVVPFLVASCGHGRSADEDKGGDTLLFRYARNITVIKYPHGRYKVDMADPWNAGKTLRSYILQDKREAQAATTQQPSANATVVAIPLSRCVVATSVHSELFRTLGCENAVAGICDAAYVKSPWLQRRLHAKLTADCGNSMSPNVEKIVDLQPDALFLSPMQNSGGYGKAEHAGAPVVELADYMEPTALGRAEWIRFYAMLLGCPELGDSLFAETERNYRLLQSKAAGAKSKPTVIMDKTESGIWYLPGGQSTIGQMLRDAGMAYVFAGEKSSGSIQRPFETMLDSYASSDLWLMRYFKPGNSALTLSELASENQGYSRFKAFRNHTVYGCNTATTSFFEETPFSPDLLLRDFIIIAHPEIKGLGEARYFTRLNP